MHPIRDYGSSLALLLILIATAVFIDATSFANQATGEATWWQNLSTDLIGAIVTILLFEIFIERRRRLAEKEKSKKTEKERLIVEMRSQHNAIAINAVRQMRAKDWLQDGSLQNADLRNANLRYADLSQADLSQADLRGVDFYNAQLDHANIFEAVFDKTTTLPDGNYWSVNIKMKRYLVNDANHVNISEDTYKVIDDGIKFIQSGNHDMGAYLLRSSLRYYDLSSEQQALVLMWLAETSNDLQYKIAVHQQAQKIDPNNQAVAVRLSRLTASTNRTRQQEHIQAQNDAPYTGNFVPDHDNERRFNNQTRQSQVNQRGNRSMNPTGGARDYNYGLFETPSLNLEHQQTTQLTPAINDSMDDTEPMDYEQFENPSPTFRQQSSRERPDYMQHDMGATEPTKRNYSDRQSRTPSSRQNHSPSGRQNHSPSGRQNHSPSGRQNHSPSGRQNHSPSGRQNHSPSGRQNHSPSGRQNHSPSGRQNHSPSGRTEIPPTHQQTYSHTPEPTKSNSQARSAFHGKNSKNMSHNSDDDSLPMPPSIPK